MHIACVVIDEISWLLSTLGCLALLSRHFACLRIWQQQELLVAFDARLCDSSSCAHYLPSMFACIGGSAL